MIIASAQISMGADVAANLATMTRFARCAGDANAELVVFPELTLSGCHRGILDVCETLKADSGWRDDVSQIAQQCGIDLMFGVPTFRNDKVFDTYLHVDRDGQFRHSFDKIGLTESEKFLFTPGNGRSVWQVGGLRVLVVVCREVMDLEELLACKFEPDLIIWPSFTSVEQALPPGVEPVTPERAATIAATIGAPLIQSNWANSLNRPELVNMGGNIHVANGQIEANAPLGSPGILYVETSNESSWWTNVSAA